jgi:uncharacterized protein YacL
LGGIILVIGVEKAVYYLHFQKVLFGIIGLLLGTILIWLVNPAILQIFSFFGLSEKLQKFLIIFMYHIFGLIFLFLFYLNAEDILSLLYEKSNPKIKVSKFVLPKVLDTSSIIDGRIVDIMQAGFIEGEVIVPNFVLRELQNVADSKDPMKRSRGKKGFEYLAKMKKLKKIKFEIVDIDYPDIDEVDMKLIKFASTYNAKIITMDYNLVKVAQVRGIQVLNINELINALKTLVLPGEEIEVSIIREGKNPNQGVGYLDDGTMVVVESGEELIGKKVRTIVTAVHQTEAGRIIFSKPIEKRTKHQ